MKSLPATHNFLGIEEEELCSYESSKFVIQSAPYEYTSSFVKGSENGPTAIIEASHYVEFYDEELDTETYKHGGIATLEPLDFESKHDASAIEMIESSTTDLLNDGKFVVSLGAEHTVTLGFVKAHLKKFPAMSVLQFDAHSDLRQSYHDNIYSHASVMARVHELGVKLTQIGIRAQCKEESDLIKSSDLINTFYAHRIRQDENWMKAALSTIAHDVYITIDADGFDPSVIPATGTAEPNGLFWHETLQFLRMVAESRNIVGFDVVEVSPIEGQFRSQYTLAKLVYRLMGFINSKRNIEG